MYGTFDAAVIGQPLLDMARRRLPHHAHTTVDDEADLLYRAIRREDSAAESLSSPRAAALLHALDTHGLLMELLFVPVNHNWMLTSHGVVTTLTPQDHHSMPYQSTPEYGM